MSEKIKKEVQFGALPKDFIQSQLDKLIADNKEVFSTYNVLATALKSEVNMSVPEDAPKDSVEDNDSE